MTISNMYKKFLYAMPLQVDQSWHFNQRGALVDKTLGLSAGRSGVRIPSRGKCSLRTTAVDARVNYHFTFVSFDRQTTLQDSVTINHVQQLLFTPIYSCNILNAFITCHFHHFPLLAFTPRYSGNILNAFISLILIYIFR